jgi:hypothetical protein
MSIEQILQDEIRESHKVLDGPIDDTIYRRDHSKRIELINWVLENMKNSKISICDLMESKMNETVLKINKTHSLIESDVLHSELCILDWIFYQVCSRQEKNLRILS